MTDFLSRLVDRALGDAPVAEPLIAPHFAPGAEIFGPDGAPFDDTPTENYSHAEHDALDTIASAAPQQGIAPPPGEEAQPHGLKHEEAERYSTEERESPRSSEEAAREVEPRRQSSREQRPEDAGSALASYFDSDESPTVSPLPGGAPDNQAIENQATGNQAIGNRAASTGSRDLAAGIKPLPPKKETQTEAPHSEVSRHEIIRREVSQFIQQPGQVKPDGEMRKDMALAEQEQPSMSEPNDSTVIEGRTTERHKSLTPRSDSRPGIEGSVASSSSSNRTADDESEPRLPARVIPSITVSLASEPVTPPATEPRGLPAGVDPLLSNREIQSHVTHQEIHQQESPQPARKPDRVRPAAEMRKDMALAEQEQPSMSGPNDSTAIEGRTTERHKSLTPRSDSHPGDESEPRLPTRVIPSITVSLASEPVTPPATELRGLPAGVDPLLSNREIQSHVTHQEIHQQESPQPTRKPDRVRPAAEMRKDMALAGTEQNPVRSTKDSAALEDQRITTIQRTGATPAPGNTAAQSDKPLPVLRPSQRESKQTTSEQYDDNRSVKSTGEGQITWEAASVSRETVTPAPAIPVAHGPGTARLVRPEKISVREREGSHFRTNATDATPTIQPAPSVKVTIGRIEVRAVFPPAPQAQETALPAPKMSLDDYLKSLSGGRQ